MFAVSEMNIFKMSAEILETKARLEFGIWGPCKSLQVEVTCTETSGSMTQRPRWQHGEEDRRMGLTDNIANASLYLQKQSLAIRCFSEAINSDARFFFFL